MEYTKQELDWYSVRYWQEGGRRFSENARELFSQYIDGLDESRTYNWAYFTGDNIDRIVAEIMNDRKTYSVPKSLDDDELEALINDIHSVFMSLRLQMYDENIGLFTPFDLNESAKRKYYRKEMRDEFFKQKEEKIYARKDI